MTRRGFKSLNSTPTLALATMTIYEVSIKHAGKAYNLSLDTDLPPAAFKQAIYETTGVPPDRMKVMAKGLVLKVNGPLIIINTLSSPFSARTIHPGQSSHSNRSVFLSSSTCRASSPSAAHPCLQGLQFMVIGGDSFFFSLLASGFRL